MTTIPDFRTPQPLPPRRCYTLRINVGGDSWEDVIRSLREAESRVQEAGPDCKTVSGGVSAGYFVEVEHHPEMTGEKYHEAIDVYRQSQGRKL